MLLGLLLALSNAWATPPVSDDGYVAVDLVDNATPEQVREVAELIGLENLQVVSDSSYDEALYVGYTENPLAAAAILSQYKSLVEIAEPVITFEVQGEAVSLDSKADPDYTKQWHMKGAGAEYVWANTQAGKGTIVAILDTGFSLTKDFDPKHVDLKQGRSFVPNESVDDGHGHGSHCASTVAQWTGNGFAVAGLAPETTILPIKVLSNAGSGASTWIASGIDYAADTIEKSGKPGVISMSLGSGAESKIISQAAQRAIDKGVIVVAAAGNSGGPHDHWPASYPPIISVGSVGPTGHRAYYSSYGTQLDIMERGGDKKHAGGGVFQWIKFQGQESLQEWQGTSMATPHAAADVAVLFSEGHCVKAKGAERQKCVENLFKATAIPRPPNTRPEEYAAGTVDLVKALKVAGGKEVGTDATPGVDDGEATKLPHPSPAGNLTFVITALSVFTILGLNRVYGGFSKYFVGTALATAVASSGPLYALTFLPYDLHGLSLLMVPWLEAPEYIFGQGVSSFPLWLSALPLVGPFLVMTPFPKFRPIVVGLLTSTISYLALNAFTGFNSTGWMSPVGDSLWLSGNALVVAALTFVATEFQSKSEGKE